MEGESRRFYLYRLEDTSGVSGIGVVADGVVFPNGFTALAWRGRLDGLAFYRNLETLMEVHGHGGRTLLEWLDMCPQCVRLSAVCPVACKNCVLQ